MAREARERVATRKKLAEDFKTVYDMHHPL